MKLFILISFIFSIQKAKAESKDVLIDDQTYTVDVALNKNTVLCLQGDYGANSFKIAVPQIDDLTFLDHTSPGAPGPCINAGFCKTKDLPFMGATTDDRFPIFHDLLNPIEMAQVRVIRKEVLTPTTDGRCLRTYVEHISSTIRGTLFQHEAHLPLAELKIENCQ